MARTDMYGERYLVGVPACYRKNNDTQLLRVGSDKLLYGFKTPIDSTYRGELGQTELMSGTSLNLGDNLVFVRASYPVPPRFKKAINATSDEPAGSVSSYGNYLKINEIRGKGWSTLTRYSQVAIPVDNSSTARGNVLCYVKMPAGVGGYKFGWSMPRYQIKKLGGDSALQALNIKVADLDDGDIVYASEFPKPGRMAKTVADDGGNTYETYAEPGADLPANWALVQKAILSPNQYNLV